MRPLRLFERPEQIKVIAQVPDGPPARFVWRRATHAVVRAEGPERVAMEWWRAESETLTRDYFRVEDEAGLRFWLYRDGLYDREIVAARGQGRAAELVHAWIVRMTLEHDEIRSSCRGNGSALPLPACGRGLG